MPPEDTMNFLTTCVSSTHTYRGGNAQVDFFIDDAEALSVAIDTEKVHMRSVQPSDVDAYASLFGDADVVKKMGNGQPKTRVEIEDRVTNSWIKRWHDDDPYSGLAVFKEGSDAFLGHVVLGHGDAPGQAELAYILLKNSWRQGFGKETAATIVHTYAPATVKEGFSIDGKVLETIMATARLDNPASLKILTGVGMHKFKEEERFGAARSFFSIDLRELPEDSVQRT